MRKEGKAALISALALGLSLVGLGPALADMSVPSIPKLPSESVTQHLNSFMVSPIKVEFNLRHGLDETRTVKVVNRGRQDVHIRTEINDFFIKPDNTFQFFRPEHRSFSSASWISLSETEFDLAPREEKLVDINVSVPRDAEIGDHTSTVFFQTIAGKPKKSGLGVVGRIGELVFVTVGKKEEIVRSGEIRRFDITSRWWDRNISGRVVFHNGGNVHLTLKGKIEFSDGSGRIVGTAPFKSITILPGTNRILTAEWKAPLAGRFTARAKISYGPNLTTFDTDKISSSIPFVMVSAQLISILLLAFTLLIGIGLYLKRRFEQLKPVLEQASSLLETPAAEEELS